MIQITIAVTSQILPFNGADIAGKYDMAKMFGLDIVCGTGKAVGITHTLRDGENQNEVIQKMTQWINERVDYINNKAFENKSPFERKMSPSIDLPINEKGLAAVVASDEKSTALKEKINA